MRVRAPPGAPRASGRAAEAAVFQTASGGFDSRGALSIDPASANGRPAVFEAAHQGSNPCAGTNRSGIVQWQDGRLWTGQSGFDSLSRNHAPSSGDGAAFVMRSGRLDTVTGLHLFQGSEMASRLAVNQRFRVRAPALELRFLGPFVFW